MNPGKVRKGLMMLVGLLLLSCSKPEEGCLDIRATNFDATADESCCCTYPVLRLLLSHAAGSVFHSPDSVYVNDAGQSYRIMGVDYFLSDVALLVEGTGWVRVSDSLTVTLEDGSILTVDDDILHVSRNQSSYSVGTLLTEGVIDSISFRIGLIPDLVSVDPEAFPADHPLHSPPDVLVDPTGGFGSVAVKLIAPAENGDTLTWSAALSTRVTLDVGQTVLTGYDVEIPMTVDYLQWIREEDVAQPSVINVTDWMARIALSFRYGNL